MSSVLMVFMHHNFGSPALDFDTSGRVRSGARAAGLAPLIMELSSSSPRLTRSSGLEHLVHVRTVLETLRHHKPYVKASKCQFCRSSVGFLCYVISEQVLQ